MTDFTAHDIHRLDQAYPDALADLETFIGDPKQKAALADKGTEVYAAELTRDLADTATSPIALAAWAAIATVRLMEAGRVWEEDTDAAWAKVAELTAERDAEADYAEHLRDALRNNDNALAQSRAQAATYANEIGTLTAENARLRSQLAECEKPAGSGHFARPDGTCWSDCPVCHPLVTDAEATR